MAETEQNGMALKRLRKKIFLTGYKGGMAHLASCFSALEILYALYLREVLRIDKNNPKWSERDRFVLSKGHAGLALYCILNEAGLISDETYDSYLQRDSLIGGEPCVRDCEWIEATTGSLGHGMPMAVGMAMALKMNSSTARVYVLVGDGECEEGTTWEAAMNASRYGLDNLVVILDSNKLQKMESVEDTIGAPRWREKWSGFGFEVWEVDGHDVEAIVDTLAQMQFNGKPHLVIAHTTKGKGVSIMEGRPNWHFKLPGKKELKVFMEELEIAEEELE